MIKENFQKKVKQHLSHYKKGVINVYEMGINGNRGFKKPYEHILPERLSRLNIIEQYRDDYFSSEYHEIDYHNCFHHMNSSQALCINLFYPLIAENKLNLISELLNLPDGEIKEPAFEYTTNLEQTCRGRTSFDFYFEIARHLKLYIELKYTEQNFGEVCINHAYRKKFRKTYLPLLADNPFIRDEYKRIVPFLKNYQIMRNLVHISDSSFVVFIYSKANRNIQEQALQAYEEMVTKKGKNHLKLLTMEETLQHIKSSLKEGRLKRHFVEFEEKYMYHLITKEQ